MEKLEKSIQGYLLLHWAPQPDTSEIKNDGPKYSREPFENNVRYSLRDVYNSEGIKEAIMKSSERSPECLGKAIDRNMQITFQDRVREIVGAKGLRDSEVYRAAQIDRRLYSKVMSGNCYKASKDTYIALCMGLRLTIPEMTDLLSRVGYTLSHSIRRDVIIEFFFAEGLYDVNNLNEMLARFDCKPLGREMS